jgi:acyltransferase
MNERIYWLDTLRAIGIFFVVLLHTGKIHESHIIAHIKSCAIPLFFFISGLLTTKYFYTKPFVSYLKKIAQRSLVPYICFSAIGYCFWLLVLRHFKSNPFDPLHSLIGIAYSSGSNNWLSFNIALWYFTCLAIVQIIFYWLMRTLARQSNIVLLPCYLLFLSIVGYLVTTYITTPDTRLPWSIDIALTATVFYGVGYLLQPYILTDLFLRWQWLGIFAASIGSIFCSAIENNVEFYVGVYGNYGYFYLSAFSGILLWTYIARWVRTYPLVTAIGQNTLVIFSTHLLIIPCLTGFFVYALKIPEQTLNSNIFISVVYTVICILLLLPISFSINYYLPSLVGRSVVKPVNSAS